ncbi:MAG TPA: fibronectin type III domain-containing protein [Acidimicrobiales bacterium]|nr:fibronectin type III domain-containing protein [Acidimicrobiales bacterium]
MTAIVRPRSIAAFAVFILATAGFLAPAAHAGTPTVTITAPGRDQILRVSSFPVSAEVTNVGKIRFGLTPVAAGAQAPLSRETTATSTARQVVSFNVSVEYNGKYRADVSADHEGGTLDINSPPTASASREFFVAAPPEPPLNVRAVVDPDSRGVTVSWNANTEKDLLFYVVKKAKGDGAYSPLATTNGPGDTSVADPSTAESGGEYRYQVVAVRRGQDADSGVTSDPSQPATATVPDPPGPPTTAGPDSSTPSTTPGGSTSSNTTGTTFPANSPGALKKSGTIDLSGFSAIQSQARRSAVRSTEPDPGFTETLPFGTTDTTRLLGDDEQASSGAGDDEEVRELGAEDANDSRQQSAAFLAAGLLATVLLMHLLWIKGEVQREPLEVLVPE